MIKQAALLAVIVTMASAAPVLADTFTESVQFGSGPTDFMRSTGTTAGPGGTQLYYFDSNGGTLNSITFRYSYAVNSRITVTDYSGARSSGTAYIQSAAQFSADASAVTSALNGAVNSYVDPVDGNSVRFGNSVLSPIAADVRGTGSSYDLASGGSETSTSQGSYARGPYTITDASVLAAFSQAGGGTFTPLFSTLTGLVISNSGGNTTDTQSTTAQGDLVISFNYSPLAISPVPEPATFALLGAGLVGMVVARRRFS